MSPWGCGCSGHRFSGVNGPGGGRSVSSVLSAAGEAAPALLTSQGVCVCARVRVCVCAHACVLVVEAAGTGELRSSPGEQSCFLPVVLTFPLPLGF